MRLGRFTRLLLVSQKDEKKLRAIQSTEEVFIDADGVSNQKDPLKEKYVILHHPSYADFCNGAEWEGNEKVPRIHEGSASGNESEMELVLSPDKEKRGPPL